MEAETLTKCRLDTYLVRHHYFSSRSSAIAAIKQGCVTVNQIICKKPSFIIEENSDIIIKGACPWVSRGGLKLEHALKFFNISVSDKICLDLGASTGGFCDVLLNNHCQKIYAVDVGHSQLHPIIAGNSKVVNLEKIPAKLLNDTLISDKIDFLCVDVSFISVTKVLDYIFPLLKPFANIVILCKPQFELSPKALKKGIVKEAHYHTEAKQNVIAFLESRNMHHIQVIDSPITGTDGNHEYLIYCKNH
jgi:23S rRNA (cytidine1920-2'-O)/16S rRNA (cytidine1409-2'-O)-methyltransferase